MKRHSVGWVAEGIKTVWEGEDGLWQLRASTRRWIFCKRKVLGKDWLLPNIHCRKRSAFAAAGGEEKLLSKSLLMFCRVSSESTDWKQNHKPALLDSPLCDLQENLRCRPISSSFQYSLHSSGTVQAEDDALCVLLMQWAKTEWFQGVQFPSGERWRTFVLHWRLLRGKKLAVSHLKHISFMPGHFSLLCLHLYRSQVLSVSTFSW